MDIILVLILYYYFIYFILSYFPTEALVSKEFSKVPTR